MAGWHLTEWHSSKCIEGAKSIGALERTFSWLKVSAAEGCQGCDIVRCAVEKYCERWYTPEQRQQLTAEYESVWSESDVQVNIYGNAGNLAVHFTGGFMSPLRGTLDIFTDDGEYT